METGGAGEWPQKRCENFCEKPNLRGTCCPPALLPGRMLQPRALSLSPSLTLVGWAADIAYEATCPLLSPGKRVLPCLPGINNDAAAAIIATSPFDPIHSLSASDHPRSVHRYRLHFLFCLCLPGQREPGRGW